jgi:hypothetical protein
MQREGGILVVPDGLDCVALTVTASVTTLAARTFPEHQYRRAVVQTDQPVRWTASPTDSPSGTFGLLLEAGQTLVYDGNLNELEFIRAAGASADATLIIHYFGLS